MSDRQLRGIGVSPGIGIGPAVVVRWSMPEVPHRVVPRSQVEREIRRLRAAVRDVKRYLQDLKAKAEDRAGVDEARIFDAQVLMLEDKEFLAGVAGLIRENHLTAEKAYEFKARSAGHVGGDRQPAAQGSSGRSVGGGDPRHRAPHAPGVG
ncbi:MAG TPA: phosphoenolpyruvate-utilizing N-terminal domain-containing protein [Gemmatimonadales bacterium]|nr:phosphoenolpyruvate-utilizing N-terminal domain-containing protein [Gemmatimonadales bacterium]